MLHRRRITIEQQPYLPPRQARLQHHHGAHGRVSRCHDTILTRRSSHLGIRAAVHGIRAAMHAGHEVDDMPSRHQLDHRWKSQAWPLERVLASALRKRRRPSCPHLPALDGHLLTFDNVGVRLKRTLTTEHEIRRIPGDYLVVDLSVFLRFRYQCSRRSGFSLSRCSRSRAVFASRAARSMSVNALAAPTCAPAYCIFLDGLSPCLSRISCPRSDGMRSVGDPNDRREIVFPQTTKKPAPLAERGPDVPAAECYSSKCGPRDTHQELKWVSQH